MRKFALFVVLVFLSLAPSLGWAKSYFHPTIEQTFVLQGNGDVEVTEKRSFSFEGSFSWARLTILRKGAKDIVFEGVWDEQTGEPLPFEMERNAQEVGIRWSYQAQDEVRVFRIQYRLVGVVRRFEDVAELYWKVIEDQHARIEELSTEFVLPQESPGLLKLFVHTEAAPGEMRFPEDRRGVHFHLWNIPANTFVEARLLTEPDIFPATPLQEGRRYEAILAEERVLAEATTRASRRGMIFLLLFGGFGLVYVVLFFIYYFRYGREPHLRYEREYEQEPPRPVAPCFLGVFLSQKRDFRLLARAFFATILDLARKGYLTIHEEEKQVLFFHKEFLSFRLTGKSGSGSLNPFEKEVLSLLESLRKGSDASVTTRDIEVWGKEVHGNRTNMLIFLENWDRELRKEVEEKDFPILDRTSERKKNLFVGLGIAYFIAGCLAIATGASSLGAVVFLSVPLVVLAIFFAVLGWRFLSRWSKEAALEYRRWMAFRRFLSDFSLLKEAGAQLLALWDQYLVYAVVLGVAEKLLQNIKRYVQEAQVPFRPPSWYYPVHGVTAGFTSLENLAHLDALSRSVENMVNLGQALSTTTTSGGGFSGGGGGGGGGGGSSSAG